MVCEEVPVATRRIDQLVAFGIGVSRDQSIVGVDDDQAVATTLADTVDQVTQKDAVEVCFPDDGQGRPRGLRRVPSPNTSARPRPRCPSTSTA